MISKSEKGNWMVSIYNNDLFLSCLRDETRFQILSSVFDSSKYSNAFFTSDGKLAVFDRLNKKMDIIGFEDLELTSFVVDGSTVSVNAGVNGYNFELDSRLFDGRLPVWRDPITLNRIDREDILKYTFSSPDGKWIANNNFEERYYNRLLEKEMSIEEYYELKQKYDFNSSATDEEKRNVLKERKALLHQYGKEKLLHNILVDYSTYIKDADELEQMVLRRFELYLSEEERFTPLFVDVNGYVVYKKIDNEEPEERKVLIGRGVWFLNYVSFSYDSRFLAFGAKMKEDDFRHALEGVFVLYDLENNKEIIRSDKNDDLYAVWMTMFSKKGDVAYYDSHANTFIAKALSNYEIEEAEGKSLLCFSPSGNYIALSDQKYIDYTHHPYSNWGHQPSGNVFIHDVSNFSNCLEQYNDFGEGISGIASRAGCVASAAFSQDEKRLLAVGTDGVVVVRNLHIKECEDYCDFEPTLWQDPERPDYRVDERRGFVYMSNYGIDGITTDVFEYWCGVDETLDAEQGLVYSSDGTKAIRSLNIYREQYVIKDGVKRVENGLFHGVYGAGEGDVNNIKRLFLPNSVEYIGDDVFDGELRDITIYVDSSKIFEYKLKFPKYKDCFAVFTTMNNVIE